jgi:hypothetical protein
VTVCGDARLTLIDGVEKPDELAEDLMANLAETSHTPRCFTRIDAVNLEFPHLATRN